MVSAALTSFLTGETYARIVSRGQVIGSDPVMRWTRPSTFVKEPSFSKCVTPGSTTCR